MFFGRSKAGNLSYLDGPCVEAVFEVIKVLFGQQGGGHQYRHLAAAHDGHKGSAQCHFGLTKAHVTADQAVHGATGLHVFDDVFNRFQLIRGFFKRKTLTERFVVLQT